MKIMLIGAIGAGKTTLIQALKEERIRYTKTQVVEYNHEFIDTPGEYMQHRMYWYSLTTTSHDADLICLVHDASSEDFWFSPGITSKFEKPVIGIITKIDKKNARLSQAKRFLDLAGCRGIYPVSSFTGEGIESLQKQISEEIIDYHNENCYRYAATYFD